MKPYVNNMCPLNHRKAAVALSLAALLSPAVPLQAGTVAFWTFEGDGITTPTDGTFVKDTDGRTTVTADGILVQDVSGNGNSLFTWDNNSTGHQYRNNVPASVVPQTGAPNNFSIQNNGGYPATFTWSSNSVPTVDVETIEPLAWTIEASIYQTAITTHATFVGRDGNGETNVTGVASERAPVYFKTQDGVLQILFTDASGATYDLADTTGPISINTWYNVAAVSDGTTLSLYKDSGAGYVLVNSMALTSTDTRLNYDSDGSSTPNDSQWGWSIGRGRWSLSDAQGDGHTDRFFGYIDNVRISDSALTTNQFLGYSTNVFVISGPTPAAQTVALGAPASFSILAGGQPPLYYQWRHDGAPISGANSATYNIAATVAGSAGNYDVIITNINNAVTSSVATLTIHNPRTLTWGGVAGTWDTTSANWTTNNGSSFLAYFETDDVRFDPLGAAQPLVTLSAPRNPSSIVVSNASYTFAGASISNSAPLTLQSNATLSLEQPNTLGTISVGSGSTLTVNSNQTFGSLSGAGKITSTNGAPVLTFGSANLNSTWSGTITNSGGSPSFIKVGTGTNTFSGANYLAGTAASQVNGGALILPAGGSINPMGTAEFWIAQGANTGYVEINGGTLSCSNWIVVGRQNAAANGTMVVNSGTVNKTGTSGNIVVGSLGATGTLIINGGQVLNNANLWLGENTGANATLRLNGGLLQATQIRTNGSLPTSAIAYFNGGTLQPSAASTDFIPSPVQSLVSAGGLKFDNNGFDIVITSMLLEDSLSTGGGLTKFGAGTLALNGGHVLTGPVLVRQGTLSLSPSSSYYNPVSTLTITNATLSLDLSGGTTTLPAGNVTLQNNAVLSFNYGTLFANPVAAIAATGNLTAPGSTITINISGAGFTAGTVPLITYGGTPLGSIANFVLGALPPGMGANLVNNPNSLDLNITVVGQNLSWYGNVDNVWDVNNTANWQNSLVPGAVYLEYGATGDPVRFDDTAAGNYDINLTTNVHPFSVTEDAFQNYSITGAGGITGATSIVKSNTGTLSLGTVNTHTGGTFVYGGSLAISNNSALGSASVPVTLAGGNLQLENNVALATRPVSVTAASTVGVPTGTTATVGGTISGSAALRKVDSGTLNLTGSNTITGAIDANLGTINISGTNAPTYAAPAYMGVGSTLGSATINLLPGARVSRFEVKLGNQTGAKGTFNMTNATLVTGGGEIWVGGSADNISCEGEFNLVGGSVLVSNWTAVGRSFGNTYPYSKGVLNIIGGAWTNLQDNNFVVTSATNNMGIVNVSSGGIIYAQNQIWVGEGGSGILNINDGTVYGARTANPAMVVGRANASAGSIRLNSGLLESSDQTVLGHTTGTASYGELYQSGGTFISRWYFVVGFNNDRSIYRQTGGAFYLTNAFMTVGAGGLNSIGVADLSGGTFTTFGVNNVADSGAWIGERGFGTLNVRGTSVVNLSGTNTGGGLRIGGQSGARGIVNLSGGVLTTPRLAKGNAAGLATVNFNGGCLKASLANTAYMTGLDNAYIYSGGATIDDGGNAITIAQPLLAPPGNGVTAIAVADGGSGYIGAPIVQINGGTGTPATAVANMVDDGTGQGTLKVGSVTITSPGAYSADPTNVSFLMGGQRIVVATAGAITTATNSTSGGLTKIGSGTTTLNGTNNYTGLTTVSNGTLNVNGSIGAVTVKTGARLGGSVSIGGVLTVEAGATIGAGTSIGTMTLAASPSLAATATVVAELDRTNSQTADRINVTGNPIAYNGTLVVTNIGNELLQVGDTFKLFDASSYSGTFTLVSQTPGEIVTWNTSNLAVNGTITVATAIATIPGTISYNVSGNTLTLSWPALWQGWILEAQTNSLGVGLSTTWYPVVTNVTSHAVTINPANPTVFFRQRYPN